jgi:hypothetical protein
MRRPRIGMGSSIQEDEYPILLWGLWLSWRRFATRLSGPASGQALAVRPAGSAKAPAATGIHGANRPARPARGVHDPRCITAGVCCGGCGATARWAAAPRRCATAPRKRARLRHHLRREPQHPYRRGGRELARTDGPHGPQQHPCRPDLPALIRRARRKLADAIGQAARAALGKNGTASGTDVARGKTTTRKPRPSAREQSLDLRFSWRARQDSNPRPAA